MLVVCFYNNFTSGDVLRNLCLLFLGFLILYDVILYFPYNQEQISIIYSFFLKNIYVLIKFISIFWISLLIYSLFISGLIKYRYYSYLRLIVFLLDGNSSFFSFNKYVTLEKKVKLFINIIIFI